MRAYIKMILCFAVILCFVKFAPLVLEKVESYKAMTANSEALGIDNAALFYSEEPHSLAAEKYMKEQLK